MLCLAACSPKTPPDIGDQFHDESYLTQEEKDDPKLTAMDLFREEASRIAASMDDSTLAAQCLLAVVDNRAFFSDPMKILLQEIPAGGIILFRYNLTGTKDEIRSFLKELSDFIELASGVAPFMTVDHEGGLVHRFGPGIYRLPAPYSFWEMAQSEGEAAALRAVEELAQFSGEEISDLGINLNLAPVAEFLSPKNQAFLDTRSYGPDPDFTEKAASAFIRGMESAGIAWTIKHFPGNSAEDPHYRLSEIQEDLSTLDAMVRPFRGIIKNLHVPVLMLSHSVVPALDPQRNASLSPVLINTWLRDELGFSGIVLADDFSMEAVTARGINAEEAVIQALNAGVDMIMCWPSNMRSLHRAILGALKEERLPRQRLLEAAERIIAEKLRL
jgi:beta-N-acetylhexosaminidase